MIGTSAGFQAAVVGPHQMADRCSVIENGAITMTLPVFQGSVTADRTAARMRRMQVTLADPDGTYAPADISSTLAPGSTQIFLERGVRVPNVGLTTDLDDSAAAWGEGTNNGTIGDPITGRLILGWGS